MALHDVQRCRNFCHMTSVAEKVLLDALALPVEVRADLTDRLIASLEQGVPPEIERAQISEVRRRITQVQSGVVQLIPGEEALARIRSILTK